MQLHFWWRYPKCFGWRCKTVVYWLVRIVAQRIFKIALIVLYCGPRGPNFNDSRYLPKQMYYDAPNQSNANVDNSLPSVPCTRVR